MPVDHRLRLHQGVDQRRRRHHIAQAQARKQYLRQRTDVDHATGAVQALQRCQGRAGVTVLAVVVVLGDPGAVRLGPAQQREAPAQAHGHAEGQLVRGCGEDHRGVRVVRGRISDVHAFGVDRHQAHARTGYLEGCGGAPVAGRLQPHPLARRQQQLRQQVEGLLRPSGNNDLLGRAAEPARGIQVGAQQLAQRRMAGGGTQVLAVFRGPPAT